jgi:hypothetical protein
MERASEILVAYKDFDAELFFQGEQLIQQFRLSLTKA